MLDFKFRFDVPSNVFLDSWNKYKGNIGLTLQVHGFNEQLSTEFGEEVNTMLLLLKLLPERPKGRQTIRMRALFDKTIEKLLVYSKVIQCEYFYQCLI